MIEKIKDLVKNEKGQALILVALSLSVLLGITALTIDYGYLAWQKRNLQNAADASALAAAWELPQQAKIDIRANEYAIKYADPIIVTATMKNENKEVEVYVEKSYPRIFGRIFIEDSDYILSAKATAEKTSFYTGILPFGLRDDHDGDLDELILSGYVTYMKGLLNTNIDIWGKDDETNLKFGLLKLGPFTENNKENTSPKDVIETGLDKSIYGRSINIEEGMQNSIDQSNDALTDFLIVTGNKAYMIGILPGRASYINSNGKNGIIGNGLGDINNSGSNNTTAYWGEYVILYFENINLSMGKDEDDKGKDKVNLSGTLKGVYNIYAEEFPAESFYEGKSSRLIK